jgi:hypothetical protein
VFILAVLFIAYLANKGDQRAPSVTEKSLTDAILPSVTNSGCRVTLTQYSQLQTGMSYAQTRSILGCAGTEASRVDMAGYTTVMYQWDGNSFGANMNVTIQNDALVSKAQFGLR